jgi:FAD:protein FMN transferase
MGGMEANAGHLPSSPRARATAADRLPSAGLRFTAMGSDAHVIVVGASAAEQLRTAVRRIGELEARWSRFVGSSEICELNRRAGGPVEVSAETVLLVRRAVEAWRLTGGGFDPTVLGAVIRAGYDRSFVELADGGPADRGRARSRCDLGVGCTDIVLTPTTVTLPAGTGFDPGGIGKGLAADLVVAELSAAGADGALVNLGGDLRVLGCSDADDPTAWTIAVEHPRLTEPLALLGLREGAVCTSTTLRRTWTLDGARRHHLIDPSTGEPSDSDLDLVTVVGGRAWHAEVLAKAVLLRGSTRAFDVLPADVQALTVDRDGAVRATDGLGAYLGGVALPARIGAAV